MRRRTKAAIAAGILVTALAVVLPGSAAADEECLAHVMTEAKMAVGRPDTVTQSVSLPPGDVTMDVHTWDGYPERVDAVQPHERVEVMLMSGGSVVLSSGITPDLADLVENASWSARFGPAAAPAGIDTVVIQHRPGDTGSPDSLWAEVTVCVEEPEPTTTTTTTTTTTEPTTTTEATTTTTEATTTTTEVAPTTAVVTTVPIETTVAPTTAAPTTEGSGVASEETGVTTTEPAPLQQLPRTGATTNALAVVGFALVGVGGSLVLITRRPDAA